MPSASTPPPAATLSVADVTVTEGNSATTNANFAVSLSKAATTPVTVGYTTANGTATAGTDYTASGGTLTFAPGVTTQTIAVKVTGDTAVEPDETFTVTLASPPGPPSPARPRPPPSPTTTSPRPRRLGDLRRGQRLGNQPHREHDADRGASKLSSWTVEFDTPAAITNIWNGQITSHTGTHYVVSNVAWRRRRGRTEHQLRLSGHPGAVGSAPTNIKGQRRRRRRLHPPTPPSLSIADLSVNEATASTPTSCSR